MRWREALLRPSSPCRSVSPPRRSSASPHLGTSHPSFPSSAMPRSSASPLSPCRSVVVPPCRSVVVPKLCLGMRWREALLRPSPPVAALSPPIVDSALSFPSCLTGGCGTLPAFQTVVPCKSGAALGMRCGRRKLCGLRPGGDGPCRSVVVPRCRAARCRSQALCGGGASGGEIIVRPGGLIVILEFSFRPRMTPRIAGFVPLAFHSGMKMSGILLRQGDSGHFHPARLHPFRPFNIAPARDENSGMTTKGDCFTGTLLRAMKMRWREALLRPLPLSQRCRPFLPRDCCRSVVVPKLCLGMRWREALLRPTSRRSGITSPTGTIHPRKDSGNALSPVLCLPTTVYCTHPLPLAVPSITLPPTNKRINQNPTPPQITKPHLLKHPPTRKHRLRPQNTKSPRLIQPQTNLPFPLHLHPSSECLTQNPVLIHKILPYRIHAGAPNRPLP